jgi:serralysin
VERLDIVRTQNEISADRRSLVERAKIKTSLGFRPCWISDEMESISRRKALAGIGILGTLAATRAAALDQFGIPLLGGEKSAQRTFYVAEWGNNSNLGTKNSPFKTISAAISLIPDLGANDVLIVMPGTYREQVVLNKGGDVNGYLTVKSLVKHAAQIRSPKNSYSAITILKDYVVVDGFDVQGEGDGHGIDATFLDGDPNNRGTHHIAIFNNRSHNNAGSGIGVAFGDFYLIVGNICCQNCRTNKYQGSGISLYEARPVADLTAGFHNVVLNNICFGNRVVDLPGNPEPPHSDGNGIIIDDFRNTQLPDVGQLKSRKSASNYVFNTLVENNLAYGNGGKGIHIFLSDNVTVRNNAAHWNNHDELNPGTWRGELSNVFGSNNIWVNNIGISNPAINGSNTAIGEFESTNCVWFNNITFNGVPGERSVTTSKENPSLSTKDPYCNIFGADPLLADPDGGTGSFRPKSGSPALNAGTLKYGSSKIDLDGKPRVVGGLIDVGPYQHQG